MPGPASDSVHVQVHCTLADGYTVVAGPDGAAGDSNSPG